MKTAKADLTPSRRGRLSCALLHNSFLMVLVLAAGPLGPGWPHPAAAKPNPPVINGNNATFAGDQHLGITNTAVTGLVPDFSTPPITILAIQNLTTDITPVSPYKAGVYMENIGAKGKDGSGSTYTGGDGDNGSDGQPLTAYYYGTTHTLNAASTPYGIYLGSMGGKGGAGGVGVGPVFGPGLGGNGGDGGLGGTLTLTTYSGPIATGAGYGIYALSKGGNGGDGGNGNATATYGDGGNGGKGGAGSSVQVTNNSTINSYNSGLVAYSFGGNGGAGGYGYGTAYGNGGKGGTAGSGGQVIVNNHGAIATQNQGAHGIDAESWGGTGGGGGWGGGIGGVAGDGGVGGSGQTVSVTSNGAITTLGSDANGILAMSHGGAGGDGGNAGGIYAHGGAVLGPGPGGYVYVSNNANIGTQGDGSRGIFAQSIGGFAGSGGTAGGLVAYGASGQSGGDGGWVTLGNTANITTLGASADALYAQSVGGGGGSGGSAFGITALGGYGDAGGNGGTVSVLNYGRLQTSQDSARGIYAQSVGGGGGDGGATASGGVGMSVAFGGQGGTGGAGGQVSVTNSNSISTGGSSADGIFAQSLGGGGGNGGFAVSGSFGGVACSLAVGGSGGGGGAGAAVSVNNSGDILTTGKMSTGLTAESRGGGGGDAGFTVTAADGAINLNFSVGGNGSPGDNGGGGAGGAVTVVNHGNISTQGELGHGLFAKSTGGGGGNAVFSVSESVGVGSLDWSLGGKGGNGGGGGTVSLDNYGNITTHGVGAYGISAGSVGGGGGDGGIAESGAVSFGGSFEGVPIPSASLAISVGGQGGLGGDGQKVTVNNYGNITTTGTPALPASADDVIPVDNSACYGIFAQSVGGGGGDAGQSAAMAVNVSAGTPSASVSVSVGGSGGSGGHGGQVEVTNTGAISTTTDNSIGIFAQSVGGGGGNGGVSRATAGGMQVPGSEKTFAIQASASVGGWGGAGGNADLVTVTDSGSITTLGKNAIGILAQSAGGGGGNGGYSVAGDMSLAQTLKVSGSVGGSGGVAGSGGAVNVSKNGGDISTSGAFAPGIQAQSIGGGGGNGGWSVDATLGSLNITSPTTNNVSVSASVGGSGGSGNLGGAVTVTNKADSTKNLLPSDISTQGDSSYGIFAQSVGGGGGNGAFSFNGTLSSQTGSDGKTWYGGGVNLQVGATVGGFGGKGGDAGTVSIDNDGNITTGGYAAHGILAQSIGGGGGVGGDSGMFNFMLPTKGTGELPSVGWNLNLNANVGGFGGDAGNGSSVTVKNTGNIVTEGEDACGIFAQSVGGGGGTGGNAWRVPTVPLPPGFNKKAFLQGLFKIENIGVFVGGYGGAAGNGGDVVVENHGDITTLGGVLPGMVNNSVHGAMGIFAQSVGGGGGTAGNANIGYSLAKIGFGGVGGSAGNGGQVTVTNYGAISTQGGASTGIFAQSVGGGGGIAGNIVRSLLDEDPDQIPYAHYFGLGTGIGLSGGDGGSGGQVTVNNSANITTQGHGAFGIFAQSVGGGGGTGGIDTAYVSFGPGKLLFNGSVFHGAPGDGGPVSVNQTGTIKTSGEFAHGIVAQSTSGSGKAGTVGVSLVGGNVVASGNGSNGIQAQSLGAGSSSNISVSLDSGSTVQGGTPGTILNTDGSTTPCNTYGVLFMDGAANVLNNAGLITTASGVSGTAVAQQADYGATKWGNLTIDNSGVITGSINQVTQVLTDDMKQLADGLSLPGGSSTITFNNYIGALFNTGSIINLGAGTLNNSGLLNLKGGGAGQSVLTGNFIQDGTGTFKTTFNGDGTCGSLKVSGTATLAGTLSGVAGPGPFLNGTQYNILQSSQPITTRFSTEDLPNTQLLSFNTQYLPNSVLVQSNVQSFTTVARNPLAMRLASHLDTLLSEFAPRLTEEFSGLLGEFQTTNAVNYAKIFESLSPGIYDADTITTLSITRQYVRTLQQRLQLLRENLRALEKPQAQTSQPVLLAYNGSNRELGQFLGRSQEEGLYRRLGFWLQGYSQWGSQGMVDGFNGFNYNLTGTAAGLDYALTERLALGANFGYGYTNINQDNSFAAGKINSLFGSLYGTYSIDRAYLEGVLSYAQHKYDNSRRINFGSLQGVAESDHTGNSFFVFMEGGYNWPVQKWTLQPFGSLLYTYLNEDGIRESGAAGLNMRVDARQTNSVVSDLGVRVARPIKTSKGTLVPEVKVAWQHDFAVSDRTLPISFAGAPLGLSVKGRNLGQDSAVVSAGLSFTSTGGITTTVKYDGELRDGYQAHAITGQIRFSF